MWNDFVSVSNIALDQAIASFVDTVRQDPIVGAGFLLGFAVLTMLFCIALVRDERRAPDTARRRDEVKALRLR